MININTMHCTTQTQVSIATRKAMLGEVEKGLGFDFPHNLDKEGSYLLLPLLVLGAPTGIMMTEGALRRLLWKS